jgi:hypothetical protein
VENLYGFLAASALLPEGAKFPAVKPFPGGSGGWS